MSGATLAVFMGLFGGSEEPDIEAIADRLGSRPSEGDVLRTLDDLTESLDRLAAAAGIAGPDGQVANDAPPAEKANELATLVDRGRLTIDRQRSETNRRDADGGGVVEAVADDLRRSRRPSGHRATSLLDALASARTVGEGEIRESLAAAVGRLEAAEGVERAIDASDIERTAARLAGIDDPLADEVRELAGEPDNEDQGPDPLEDAEVAVDRALRRVEGVRPEPDQPLAERIRTLADEATGDEEGDRPAVRAANSVRADNRAECGPARKLLDGVSSGDEDDTSEALSAAVDALNEAATYRNLTDDVDPETVASRVTAARSTASELDGTVAEALTDRLGTLSGMLDRADESNVVVPYAVREETAFYERDLLPAVESASVSSTAFGATDSHKDESEEMGTAVEKLADRRSTIHARYVDERTDHNHSIPMFFLSLVESLEAEAREDIADGELARADGMIAAADSLLERIEALYERNEYSVMLRRLRG